MAGIHNKKIKTSYSDELQTDYHVLCITEDPLSSLTFSQVIDAAHHKADEESRPKFDISKLKHSTETSDQASIFVCLFSFNRVSCGN